MLFDFISNEKVVCLNWALEGEKPQTAAVYSVLKSAMLAGKKLVVFLPVDDLLMHASIFNIPGIRVLSYDQANAYDLANSDCWVCFQKDFDRFKEMVSQWI